MPVILSYPRSGNHLVRFFIELLTETPTHGVIGNRANDIHIYQNIFSDTVPFNINKDPGEYDFSKLYIKYHKLPIHSWVTGPLIFIVRNPKEVLLRHNNYKIDKENYDTYFECLDYFNSFSEKKICFFYEDIVENKINFVNELYNFLDIKIEDKKDYAIKNIDKLYTLSSTAQKRCWHGINSNSIDYYYNKIPLNIKCEFDKYIEDKINTNRYNIIKEKYYL